MCFFEISKKGKIFIAIKIYVKIPSLLPITLGRSTACQNHDISIWALVFHYCISNRLSRKICDTTYKYKLSFSKYVFQQIMYFSLQKVK